MKLADLYEDDSTSGSLRDIIGDTIAYVKANGISKISLAQFVDLLKSSPELQGLNLDPKETIILIRQYPEIKNISKDFETGKFVINLKDPTNTDELIPGQSNPEKDKEKVSNMAKKTLKKKFK